MNAEKKGQGSRSPRRTPKPPAAKRRFPIPWLPLAVLVGVVVVAGLVSYLVWQSGQPPGTSAGERAETDDNPDLPGEYVNLPEIYDGNSIAHVTRNLDFATDGNSNPPAGGPMWGSSGCPDDPEDAPPFCGSAPSGIFTKPWEPETLNHNMEHGGVVVWYNTSHRSFLDGLKDLILKRLDRGEPLVLTPYPDMEEETIALTGWSRIDKFAVSAYSKDRVEEFLDAHVCRYNPEDHC